MILGIISANMSSTINVCQGQDMTVSNRQTSEEQMGGISGKMAQFIMKYEQVWIFVLAALALHAGYSGYSFNGLGRGAPKKFPLS